MINKLIFIVAIIFFQACGGSTSTQEKIVDNTKSEQLVVEKGEQEKEDKPVSIAEPVKIVKPIKPIDKELEGTVYSTSFESNSEEVLFESNAKYDSTIKRSGLTSIRLSDENDTVNIYDIKVKEGHWYMVSGYMYVNTLPSDLVRFYIGYDKKDGTHIRSVVHTLISTGSEKTWEEFIVPVYIQKDKDIDKIKIFVRNIGAPDTDMDVSDVWVDDISVYEVEDSSKFYAKTEASNKDAFDGEQVKVDELGNFTVKKDGKFEPFFPMIIYPSTQSKWKSYATQGFNTILCNSPKDGAVATKYGMYWIWDLTGYGISDKDENVVKEGFDRFVRDYKQMKLDNPKLLDTLLYFYWDNEQFYAFDSVKLFADKIKEMDVDASGKRLRPFSMNLGLTTGSKHYYNDSYKLMDLQSAYLSPILFEKDDPEWYDYQLEGFYATEFALFSVFENIPNVKVPKSVFVVDSPQDVHLKNTIYSALARGGKGFAFWRDGNSQPEVETKPWWDDFPTISRELNQLLPLLRTSHVTDWELKYTLNDDEDGVVVGKKDFEDKRCMILASRSSKEEVVTFVTPDRSIGDVYDYFNNKLIAKSTDDSATLTLSPYHTGVYCWR